MGNIWECCKISISIFLLLLSYPSINNCIFRFIKEKSVQVIKSKSIPSFVLRFERCLFDTWLKGSFTSLKNLEPLFFSSYCFLKVLTSVATMSITDLSLQSSIFSRCNLEYLSQYWEKSSATSFSITLPIQFSKLIIQYDLTRKNSFISLFKKYSLGLFTISWGDIISIWNSNQYLWFKPYSGSILFAKSENYSCPTLEFCCYLSYQCLGYHFWHKSDIDYYRKRGRQFLKIFWWFWKSGCIVRTKAFLLL